LEAAIRELYAQGLMRPECDVKIPGSAIYADDTDFISLCRKYIDDVLRMVGPSFGGSNLIVNVDKTELITLGLSDVGVDESKWHGARKLGSLLGVKEDVQRRIQLAWQSFNKLEALWRHRNRIAETTRLQSFCALVESVLLFNCGTWALTSTLADKLDRAHRQMLRRVLGIKWSDRVSNIDLYARCKVLPASLQSMNARWRLFGHTLRMKEDTPAKLAMAYYFVQDHKGRQGNYTTIASKLSSELKVVTSDVLASQSDLDLLCEVAQYRDLWKDLVADITCHHYKLWYDEELKKAYARRAAKL
jgi:hypothetical protein